MRRAGDENKEEVPVPIMLLGWEQGQCFGSASFARVPPLHWTLVSRTSGREPAIARGLLHRSGPDFFAGDSRLYCTELVSPGVVQILVDAQLFFPCAAGVHFLGVCSRRLPLREEG